MVFEEILDAILVWQNLFVCIKFHCGCVDEIVCGCVGGIVCGCVDGLFVDVWVGLFVDV